MGPDKGGLTGGQARDLAGADALLPGMEAKGLLADKRAIDPLEAAGEIAVIPPKKSRVKPRAYDKALYGARHLMENFFCWARQFRAIATRYGKTARNFLAAAQMVGALCWFN